MKKDRDKYKQIAEEAQKGELKKRTLDRSEAGEVAKLRSDLKRCKSELEKEQRALEESREHLKQADLERRALEAVPQTATAETANRYRQQVTEQLMTIKQLEVDNQKVENQLKQQLTRSKELESELATIRAENADLHNELAAFDPQFFDEIEDLKYQHGAAMELNAKLRDELHRIAIDHGIRSTLLNERSISGDPR